MTADKEKDAYTIIASVSSTPEQKLSAILAAAEARCAALVDERIADLKADLRSEFLGVTRDYPQPRGVELDKCYHCSCWTDEGKPCCSCKEPARPPLSTATMGETKDVGGAAVDALLTSLPSPGFRRDSALSAPAHYDGELRDARAALSAAQGELGEAKQTMTTLRAELYEDEGYNWLLEKLDAAIAKLPAAPPQEPGGEAPPSASGRKEE
jgi:hypothetical protein